MTYIENKATCGDGIHTLSVQSSNPDVLLLDRSSSADAARVPDRLQPHHDLLRQLELL